MKETYDGTGTIRSRVARSASSRSNEIRKFAGPAAVNICDECVELCNEVVARGAPRSSSKGDTSEELPTECLQPIEDTIQGRGNQLQQVVDILRSREVSWARIGAALGISRQSAWERFS
jgi:ClpX C4-type zinc finger